MGNLFPPLLQVRDVGCNPARLVGDVSAAAEQANPTSKICSHFDLRQHRTFSTNQNRINGGDWP